MKRLVLWTYKFNVKQQILAKIKKLPNLSFSEAAVECFYEMVQTENIATGDDQSFMAFDYHKTLPKAVEEYAETEKEIVTVVSCFLMAIENSYNPFDLLDKYA